MWLPILSIRIGTSRDIIWMKTMVKCSLHLLSARHHRTIKVFRNTCTIFRDAVYRTEIIIIYGSFCLLTSTKTNILLLWRMRSSSASRSLPLAVAISDLSSLRSSIRFQVSTINQILWHPFRTWPSTSFVPEKRTFLMVTQCSSILSGELFTSRQQE